MKVGDWCYEEGDVVVFRANSFGGCLRSLVAARLGEAPTPPGQKLQQVMDESSSKEDIAIARYEEESAHKVIWQQRTVELHADDGFIIRGHIDGLDQQDDVVIEEKALSDDNFERFAKYGLDGLGQLGHKYKWQGAIYGHALQRDVRFVIYGKKNNRLIVSPTFNPSDLVSLATITQKVREIEDWADQDLLPDCTHGCTRWDAYGHVHEFAAVNVEGSGSELASLLRELTQTKQQIKDFEDHRDSIIDRIKEQWGIGTHVAGPYTMNLAQVKSNRFDSKAFKRYHPELYQEFTVPSETVRLTVKTTGGTDGDDAAE